MSLLEATGRASGAPQFRQDWGDSMDGSYWPRLAQARASRRRMLIAGGSAAIGATFITACGGSNDTSSQKEAASGLITAPIDQSKTAKMGGTFLSFLRTEVQNFDPLFTSAPTQTPATMVYNRLVRSKPGYLKPVRTEEIIGDLAESWELSPDKLQLTMKLQPNAKWHNIAPVNGRAVTSQDVVFSWERFLKTGSNRAIFANAVSASAPIVSLKATDARTIVISTKSPFSALLPLLSYPQVGSLYVIPVEAEGGFDIRNQMIGTGHFYQVSHQPSVGSVYKRNDQFWEKTTFVDEVRQPIITEYAAGYAQFKAGQVWDYPVRGEDMLPAKRDDPRLVLKADDLTGPLSAAFFGWNPAYGAKTPFRDKRVRQAFSMSWDRHLWIDARFNVAKFESEGLPTQTYWNTAVRPIESGWWLDPKGKDFGPNAKYYELNLAEAKKLLAAAGFSNGLDVDANYVTTGQYGPDFNTEIEILLGFIREAGFRSKVVPSNWNGDWRTKFADSQGDFEGLSFRLALDGSHPAIAEKLFLGYHHEGGLSYTGFFSEGSSYQKGAPDLEEIINKARVEFDPAKQHALINDFQRLEAEGQYRPRFPGVGTTFRIGWPVVQNDFVFRGDTPYKNVFIDPTKAPLG